MISSEFNRRKEIISAYFKHPRWTYKGEDDWEYEYYKGKRNMAELEEAIKIAFNECECEILGKQWFENDSGEIIGATIFCNFYVGADFNGGNQGSAGGACYVAFTLARYGFFYNQGTSYESLKKSIIK